jgi:hypothetical protein
VSGIKKKVQTFSVDYFVMMSAAKFCMMADEKQREFCGLNSLRASILLETEESHDRPHLVQLLSWPLLKLTTFHSQV